MADNDLTKENCDLNQELESFREREQTLVREKMESEAEFGHQRARFIELFKQKEEELSSLKARHNSLEEENAGLKVEIKILNDKIDEIKTESTILEVGKDDEITRMQQKFQEESASFQHILKESINQAYQTATSKYESERDEWLKESEKLQSEIQELKSKTMQEKEGSLTSLAKTLQKKVALGRKEEPENLENSMKKAQEDVELLKSVVTPLEEEIFQLKRELHLRDQQIAEALNRDSNVTMDLSDISAMAECKELNHSLQTEMASRTDLEMYVRVLNTQKEVLRIDNIKLSSNLQNVIKLLEQEKLEHEDLKRTWEMANERFLEFQNLLLTDIRRLESVLNNEQTETVSRLKVEDGEREKQEKRVDELKELMERESVIHQKRKKEGDALRRSVSSLEILSNSSSLMDMAESLFPEMEAGTPQEEGTTDRSQPDNTPLHLDGSTGRALGSPSKHATDVDSTDKSQMTKNADVHSKHSSSGKRVVSDSEWQKLQIEVVAARDKLTKPCSSCESLKEKLQTSHEMEKKFQAQVRTMIKQLDAERRAVSNQEAYVKELESSLHTVVENSEVQIQTLHSKLTESEKFMKSFKDHFERGKLELFDYLKHLAADREDIQHELTRLQDENDSLTDKHSKKAQEMQEEMINFPNNLDEMQHILLKYREELITCKVTLEHNTEVLRSEISFLRSRLEAEQQERNNMEETLTQELSQLQGQLDAQKQLGTELENEREMKQEEEKKRKAAEDQMAKQVQTIETLQFEVKQLTSVKAKLDKHIQELRMKIHSLQVDLDNSEDVQRDFVKLSQTLQIQLEKIRAAETEVRWQHEEDTEDCPNCRAPFSVTKRKYHCKHCGQIFCSDCLCKTVNSGPNMRTSRVCDVCHTMLVKDATPYFSTEPPHITD